MSNLRIAVIGAGLIGRKHIDLVRRHAQLDAIVDPDEAARTLAYEFGCAWHADLDEYLAGTKPDGAIIASPNTLHLPQGMACITHEVPALIEKPLAEDADSANRLAEAAQVAGTPILVGHHRRHSPIILAAKAVIEDGRLGRLATVNALFWLNKPKDYFNVAWRTRPGGGPTLINLIHDIDLLQHLCGPITAVQAVQSNAIRGFDVEDTAAAILTFTNGALGTVSICDAVSAPWSWELTSGENPAYHKTDQSCYMFGGTQASLSLPDFRIWSHVGEQSWWSPMEVSRPETASADPLERQFLHFLNVITGDAEPLVTARDGARNIEVLVAIKMATNHGGTHRVASS